MSRSKQIIKDAAGFTISGYISSICNFISATIVRRILDPFMMGMYAELTLIFDYAKYSHLGMVDSLDRQIPYYNGKRNSIKVAEIGNIGGSFTLFASLACAAIMVIISCFFTGPSHSVFSTGLKVIAVMVVAQSMSTFYVTIVRANHIFGALGRYIVLVAVCDILFKAFLGMKFGMIGILWATIITLLVGMAYLLNAGGIPFRISFRLPRKEVSELLGIGFPLLLAGFAFMALRSIDRIVIIAFLTKEALGLYSIAIMVHSFVFQLPNLIYTVLFPRFYEAFGHVEDIGAHKSFLETPTLAFAYLFPILIGIAVITLPVFVGYVLPKYVQGIPAASILLFGTFFISITNMHGYLIIALKKQKVLVAIGIICIAACAALNIFFVKIVKMNIEGVALGTSLSYFLYSFLLIGYAISRYMKSRLERAKFFLDIYIPAAWSAFIVYVLGSSFRYGFNDIKADIIVVFFQTAVFLALSLPLIAIVNRRISLYERIKSAGFGFLKK